MFRLLGFFALPPVALATAWVATACAQRTGSVQQGLAFARDACAECHAVVKTVDHSPRANAPTFEAIAKTPGMTSMALSAALQTSHRTMPNVVVKADDVANVTAYILSLKDSD